MEQLLFIPDSFEPYVHKYSIVELKKFTKQHVKKAGQYKAYHHRVWGTDFQRDDFIGLFSAREFDAGEKLWGLSVKIPEEMLEDSRNRPCKHAWVLKFEHDIIDEY